MKKVGQFLLFEIHLQVHFRFLIKNVTVESRHGRDINMIGVKIAVRI